MMRFDPGNTGIGTIESANTLLHDLGIRQLVERKVEVLPLDDLGLENIAFMKIDVEGHEPSVLRGAQRLIQSEEPILLIESECRHNPTAFEEIEAFLFRFGYTCWHLDAGRLVPISSREVHSLQTLPITSPRYANNFIFVPRKRASLLDELK